MATKGHAIIIALGLLLSACDPRHEPKPATPYDGRVDALRERELVVLAELAAVSDSATGWPSAFDCDALLWSGLAVAAGVPVDLSLAEYSPGEMHRRPPPACWTSEGSQGSGSSISRDMLTGYLWGVWSRGDLGAMQRLSDYGESHGWVMGGGDPFRIGFGTNLKGLLGRMLKALGVGNEWRLLPTAYLPGGKDYERHLAVLGILLEGEVSNAISDVELAVLEANADDSADDALFQAARGSYDGDMGRALDLLLDPAYVPPSYVRGHDSYRLVHFLFASEIVLRRF
ncbi:MAG: hypothetical protein V4750_02815 [Pseudomonadota bacterium]